MDEQNNLTTQPEQVTKSKKAFLLIALALIAFIVIGLMAITLRGVDKQELAPSLTSLEGRWEFSEINSSGPGSVQSWIYTLSIFEKTEGDQEAIISIDGFQTMMRINAVAKQSGESVNIIFKSFDSQSSLAQYVDGDILFSLTPNPLGFEIKWGKMQPELEKSLYGSLFEKVAVNDERYELEFYEDYKNQRLVVYGVDGSKKVVIEDIQKAVPELRQGEYNYSLSKLSFPKNSDKIFFEIVLPHTDAGRLGVYSLDLNTKVFSELIKVQEYIPRWSDPVFSPSGLKIVSILNKNDEDDTSKIYLLDLYVDEVKTMLTLSGDSGFASGKNVYCDPIPDLKWIGEMAIEYSIFDNSEPFECDTYNRRFIEKNIVKIPQ